MSKWKLDMPKRTCGNWWPGQTGRRREEEQDLGCTEPPPTIPPLPRREAKAQSQSQCLLTRWNPRAAVAWAAEGHREPPSIYPTAPQSYLHPSSEVVGRRELRGAPAGPGPPPWPSVPPALVSPGHSAILPAPKSQWHRKSEEEVEGPGREARRGCPTHAGLLFSCPQ